MFITEKLKIKEKVKLKLIDEKEINDLIKDCCAKKSRISTYFIKENSSFI